MIKKLYKQPLIQKIMRFGPAGLGSIKNAVETMKNFHDKGIRACEIAFTYGVYIKDKHKKEIEEIKEAAKNYDIKLSIHAPYWINLNSNEKEKIKNSKKRILESCKIGNKLNASPIVFHPGYYGKIEKKKTYENIKNEILNIKEEIDNKNWKVKLAPETTGKVNVFGKEEEILNLVKDTGCSFCIDFAHLLARSGGKKSYGEMLIPFKSFDCLHCHFSGIEWTDKGEKKHRETPEEEIKKLLKVLPNNKVTIINESPSPLKDSEKSLEIWREITNS